MQNSEKQLEEDAANAASALSPLLGFDVEDLKQACNDLGTSFARHPLLAIAAIKSISLEQWKILQGNGDWQAAEKDKRFRDPLWRENRYFRTLLQSYLSSNQGLRDWIDEIGLEGLEAARVYFLLQLLEGGLAPSNFLLSNPEGLKRAKESKGRSILKGLKTLYTDLKDHRGLPSQADPAKFKLGENIACLDGAVVYRNELLELIQYSPATKSVYQKPVFFSTSMVNKYYLCDLKPHRSLFKFIVDQGFTLFAVSWRNPTVEHRDLGMEAYVTSLIAAIQVTCKIVGHNDVNAVGLCGGGSVLSSALAYLAKKRKIQSNSLTLLVNVLDNHKEDTDMGAITSEAMMDSAKQRSYDKGLYSRHNMLLVFSLMKPDAMIWPFVVRNYIMGEELLDSEVLYWTADQTGLPAAMHADMLDMMLQNTLAKNGSFTVRGTAIAMANIHCDTYIVGAKQDHLTPWKAVYRSLELFGGKTAFVLSNGGHITPITTAADDQRARYFTNNKKVKGADEWLAGATEHETSWRYHWLKWISAKSGKKINAPKSLGNNKYQPLVAAPGKYVHE